jgi:hypothetical protein
MGKPSSPVFAAQSKPRKLYEYGNLKFELFQGGQPLRDFKIKWTRAMLSAASEPEPEPTKDASGRCHSS